MPFVLDGGCVRLPRYSMTAAAGQGRPGPTPGGADSAAAAAARTSVLVVEDEALAAMYVSSVLSELGYDVLGVAASAKAALENAAARRPDLVLMDITLRGATDGIEAAQVLKRRHGTPILFVTAHADAATMARAQAVGPVGYLLKPFSSRQLQVAVEKALAGGDPPPN